MGFRLWSKTFVLSPFWGKRLIDPSLMVHPWPLFFWGASDVIEKEDANNTNWTGNPPTIQPIIPLFTGLDPLMCSSAVIRNLSQDFINIVIYYIFVSWKINKPVYCGFSSLIFGLRNSFPSQDEALQHLCLYLFKLAFCLTAREWRTPVKITYVYVPA